MRELGLSVIQPARREGFPAQAVGGKAAKLALMSWDLPVPSFLILTHAGNQLVANKAVTNRELVDIIRSTLGTGPFAVRSSASVEDSEVGAYAGLFHSVLGVDLEGILQAIDSVLSSANSSRVREYREAKRISGDVWMSVVVQRLAHSRVAGVLVAGFSQDPSSAVIEAVWGLGEALVGGLCEPDTIRLSPAGKIVDYRVGRQTQLLAYVDCECRWVDVPSTRRRARKLSTAETARVWSLAERVAKLTGLEAGLDMEWCFEEQDLYVVQARALASVAQE